MANTAQPTPAIMVGQARLPAAEMQIDATNRRMATKAIRSGCMMKGYIGAKNILINLIS